MASTKKDDTYINMEGVIPNSRLVIIPSPAGQKAGWKRELFLRPGAWIPWVTLTVILSTALLAIIVFVLHLNEKVRYFLLSPVHNTDAIFRELMKWRDVEHHIILISMHYDSGILYILE